MKNQYSGKCPVLLPQTLGASYHNHQKFSPSPREARVWRGTRRGAFNKSGLLSPALSSCWEERENMSSGQAVVVFRCAPTHSTFPRLRLWLRQCHGFVRRGERDGLIRDPRPNLAIEVKRSRKQFDFVPKEIEGHRAGQVGQVFKFDFAERHRLLRKIKNDGAVGIRRGL